MTLEFRDEDMRGEAAERAVAPLPMLAGVGGGDPAEGSVRLEAGGVGLEVAVVAIVSGYRVYKSLKSFGSFVILPYKGIRGYRGGRVCQRQEYTQKVWRRVW